MPQENCFPTQNSLPKLQQGSSSSQGKIKFQPDVSPYRSETLIAAEKKLLMSQASYTSRKTFCGRYVHKHSNNEGDETPRIPRASLLPALQKPLKKKSAKRKKSSSTKSRSKKDKELSPAEEVKESLRHEGLSADQKPESDNLSAVPVQRQTFEMPHISDYHPALMPVHHFVTPEPSADMRLHTPDPDFLGKTAFKLPALTQNPSTHSVDSIRPPNRLGIDSGLPTTRSDMTPRKEETKLPAIPQKQRFTQGIRFDMTWSKLEKRFRKKDF